MVHDKQALLGPGAGGAAAHRVHVVGGVRAVAEARADQRALLHRPAGQLAVGAARRQLAPGHLAGRAQAALLAIRALRRK